MAAKTDPINTSNPAGDSDPKQGDDYIRTLAAAVIELLAVDHYVGVANPWGSDASGDETGEHAKVTLHAPISDPSNVANKGHLYLKDVAPDSKAELHFQDEDGDAIQLTRGGVVYLDAAVLPNQTYIRGRNAADNGFINMMKVNAAGEVAFGVLALLANQSRLATSAAPTTDAMIPNKKYVDDQITAEAAARAFGTPTTKDSGNDDMVKAEVYKAAQDGFVTAYSNANNSATPLLGFIGSTSSPALKVGANIAASTPKKISITFPVKKDWYFKVTMSSLSVVTQNIYWHPIGPYSGPVKQ